jgi:hypothetical protein
MPRGAGQQGDHRVNRGGSWNNDARNVRVAYRNANHPDNRNNDLGFRLARAQEHAGGRVPDPPRHLSAGNPVRGEQQADTVVLVARARVRGGAPPGAKFFFYYKKNNKPTNNIFFILFVGG